MLRPLRRPTARWPRVSVCDAVARALSSSFPSCPTAAARAQVSSPLGADEPFQRSEGEGDTLDALLGRHVQESVAATSQDMLPALKVLAESLGLVRESPAFQNWSSTDWLMGLTGIRRKMNARALVVGCRGSY